MKNRRQEMLIRRIVSTAVLLAVFVLVIFGVSKIVGAFGGKQSSPQSVVASQSGAADEKVTISRCMEENLEVSAVANPPSPAVGQGTGVELTFENKGGKECSLDQEDLKVRLSTGEYTVWSPTECSSDWGSTLLLLPRTPWKTSLKWDGHLYEACKVQSNQAGTKLVADAGTYKLDISLDGNWFPSPLSLQVTQ